MENLTPQERALKIAQLMKQAEKNELFNRHLSYTPYEKQKIFHGLSAKHNQILLMGGNQLGKAVKNGTPVLTPTGYRPIESLKVGDLVIAGDGSPTRVTGVYPQGIKPLYKLTFDQGEEVICCGEHLWKFKKDGEWMVGNTDSILSIDGGYPSIRNRITVPHVSQDLLVFGKRFLHTIEPSTPAEATCISVEHEDHTFVIEHGIVTHNSYSGAYECMYHATGLYPKWWTGHRFPYPINIICGSVTFEMTMAGIQRNLLGKPTDKATWGTAALPKSCIVSTQMSGQPKNFVSKIVVKHASGLGNSVINLTCYAKGREAWQADKADLVWFDEEPPYDVFDEGFTRLTVGSGPDYGFTGSEHRGFCYTTFTPLMGMSEVVRTFYPKPLTDNKAFVQLGIFDVNHLTDDEKRTKIMEYAPHLREARAYGIPVMGEGAIFNFDWESIVIPAFSIPPHWYQINGIDFGIAHDSAGIKIAHDRDTDTIYVMQCHKEAGLNSSDFASRVRLWGGKWSWPHDGAAHEKGSGETLADQYKKHGLDMLPDRATHDGKSNSLEASIMDVNERFQTGRLFIFQNPGNAKLVDELRQYHRKQGKPVAIYDDAISAMRYAIMMVRFAVQDKPKNALAKRVAALNGYKQSGNLGINGSFMSS